MNEKMQKMLKEMKKSRRAQSMPSRRYQEQNTPQAGTSKNTNNKDDEGNASELKDQENEIQDSPFRPSNMNELRTPMQHLIIQNIDLNDSVVIHEDHKERIITQELPNHFIVKAQTPQQLHTMNI